MDARDRMADHSSSPPINESPGEPRLRVAQLIQTVDVQSGGTATAFLNCLFAIRTRHGLSVRSFAVRPPEGDPAWDTIRAAPESWSLAGNSGRSVVSGELGRMLIREIGGSGGWGGFDLLHIHGLWSPDLLAAALACRRAKIPYVWEPHGMLVREAYAQKRWKKELFMALGMRRALTSAAALVFVTAEERDHSLIPRFYGPEKCRVVPLPVQMPEIAVTPEFRARARTRFGIPQDAPCVVFMGRLHHVKRVDLALAAAAELRRTRPDLRFLIVGGGDQGEIDELKDDARLLGLDDQHAIFTGWVKGEDKWLALAAGDALTLNSVHENFGFVAPEALCVGTMPVLTANLALAGEMGAAGVAIVCAPEKSSLAAAWSRAIDENRGASILTRGREWVQSTLSPEAIGEKLEALYNRVAKNRH